MLDITHRSYHQSYKHNSGSSNVQNSDIAYIWPNLGGANSNLFDTTGIFFKTRWYSSFKLSKFPNFYAFSVALLLYFGEDLKLKINYP